MVIDILKNVLARAFQAQGIGFVLLFVVSALLGWNTIQAVQKNYSFQQRVDELNQEIEQLALENEQLGYEISYLNTDTYLEQEARESLNLKKPGENVLIIPKRSQQPSESAPKETKGRVAQTGAKIKQNLEDWRNFLFSNNF